MGHLSLLLPGLLVATAALVVPMAFVVDAAFVVHLVHEARVSFLKVAFFGFWCCTLHRFRSYFHLAYSQAWVIVVAPGRRLHGWSAAKAGRLHKLCVPVGNRAATEADACSLFVAWYRLQPVWGKFNTYVFPFGGSLLAFFLPPVVWVGLAYA